MNFRKFKPIYWIYNLLHYKELRHNKEAYKKYHVHRPLTASISSKDFPDKESKAWLDITDSSQSAFSKKSFESFPSHIQEQIIQWSRNGYMIFNNFFSTSDCDAINAEIDYLVEKKKIKLTGTNKLMFAMKKSPLINGMANSQSLKKIMGFILDKEIVAFQSINFIHGSEQRAHSDSVHMTTYPLGYLIAAWIALEDVSDQNGLLFYYPGSHKLPFLLNNDFNEGETFLTLGKKDYTDYEDVIEESVNKKGYQKKEFYAQKGDVLIWHANLVHGGSPIKNKMLTRKSMVVHYYAKDVIKYHEITERPSLL